MNKETFMKAVTNNLILNENELSVLKSLIRQEQDCTGGEFGYLGDADNCGFSKHEFAGYISSLQKKGIFEYLDTDYSTDYGGKYYIKQEWK
jgi:hypothetical protein